MLSPSLSLSLSLSLPLSLSDSLSLAHTHTLSRSYLLLAYTAYRQEAGPGLLYYSPESRDWNIGSSSDSTQVYLRSRNTTETHRKHTGNTPHTHPAYAISQTYYIPHVNRVFRHV